MASNIDKLQILNKLVLFSVWLYGKVDKFDRKRKFTLGDRIIYYCDRAQELMIEANRSFSKKTSARCVFDAMTCLDMISIKTRIACDCGTLSIKDKAMVDETLGELKDDARRWRKYFLRCGGDVAGESPETESRDEL